MALQPGQGAATCAANMLSRHVSQLCVDIGEEEQRIDRWRARERESESVRQLVLDGAQRSQQRWYHWWPHVDISSLILGFKIGYIEIRVATPSPPSRRVHE